jgi:hypothetical protein
MDVGTAADFNCVDIGEMPTFWASFWYQICVACGWFHNFIYAFNTSLLSPKMANGHISEI